MDENIKSVQHPFCVPTFSSTQGQACLGLSLANRQDGDVYFLNYCTNLSCRRKFLHGHGSTFTGVPNLLIAQVDLIKKYFMNLRYAYPHCQEIIKQMLRDGYYVYFWGVDDFYLPGKSWYGTRHLAHDGILCGYDDNDMTFSIAAYDINWLFNLIRVPQECFLQGAEAMLKTGYFGELIAYTAPDTKMTLNTKIILKGLKEYLASDFKSYPLHSDGEVKGIAVHDFLALYMEKLKDGSIPYEKMDWLALRTVWEHKKCMLDRIRAIEKKQNWDASLSTEYQAVVALADHIRMMYALYHKKKRDSLLDSIVQGLLKIKEKDQDILQRLVDKMETCETQRGKP